MTEREELATRIETNPLGWLPVVGNVINVTFTPDEAVILIGALRTPAVTDEMVDALEEQVQYLNTNANRLTGALSRLDWEPRRSHVEGDRNTFVRVSERLRAILTAALAAKSSPAPIESSLPSGESDPLVTLDYGGADPEAEALAMAVADLSDELARLP